MKIYYYDIHQEDLEGFYSLLPDDLVGQKKNRYMGAVDREGYACGILVWQVNGGRVDIEHIAVDPDLRRQGIGTGLLDALMERLEASLIFAPVSAVYELDSEHEEFDGFIRKVPYFDLTESGRFHIISSKVREEAEYYKSLKKESFHTHRFLEVAPGTRKRLYKELEKQGISLFKKHDEVDLIPHLCLCRLSNEEVVALVLISYNNRKELCVSFAYCKHGRGVDLGACLCEVAKMADKFYPDAPIVFDAENEKSVDLSRRLFGEGIQEVPIYTAVSFGR